MGMKYFCCGLCGIAVQKESSPGSNGCTNGSRNGGNHHWYDLGYAGSNNYSCSNCGVVVQTASSPLSWPPAMRLTHSRSICERRMRGC